jgi:hypothetical protein
LDAALAKARDFKKDAPESTIYDLLSAELYEKRGGLRTRLLCSKPRWRHGRPRTV